MSNILKIRNEARQIIAMLDENEGLITPEIETLINQLQTDTEAGLAILADIRDELNLRKTARETKAAEISALAAKDNSMIETAQKTMLAIMQSTGQKKVEIGSLQITLCDGRESVEIVDEEQVPSTYKKASLTFPAEEIPALQAMGLDVSSVKLSVSKTAIMDVHKATEGTIGVSGTRITKNPYLRIKG